MFRLSFPFIFLFIDLFIWPLGFFCLWPLHFAKFGSWFGLHLVKYHGNIWLCTFSNKFIVLSMPLPCRLHWHTGNKEIKTCIAYIFTCVPIETVRVVHLLREKWPACATRRCSSDDAFLGYVFYGASGHLDVLGTFMLATLCGINWCYIAKQWEQQSLVDVDCQEILLWW